METPNIARRRFLSRGFPENYHLPLFFPPVPRFFWAVLPMRFILPGDQVHLPAFSSYIVMPLVLIALMSALSCAMRLSV